MRHIVTLTFAAALLAGTAGAQYREPYERRGPQSDAAARVLEHLDRVRPAGYWNRGDANALEHARADLFRFRDNFARGRFARGRLDSAIAHLDHLGRSYRLNPSEREMFQRDAADLRDFRARGNGGYWRR